MLSFWKGVTMASTTQTQEQLSLKLLVNKDTNKVLFAEAGKDFVDVLLSFLTLPLGTIARLVEKESNMDPVTVGCLNKLYQSVRDLDKECMRTEKTKELLLQPTNISQHYCSTLDQYFAIDGFVNGMASFVVTDNLAVLPISVQFTSLGLLQNLGINGASSVKELIVNVTKDKILDMLKCSLLSKTTLTDSFLGKKPSVESWNFLSCYVKNNGNIQIKVKIVIRKSDGKVLYVQGEQDFADLLLSFLTVPLGGVVRVLGGHSSMDNIDALYTSIDNLDETKYLMSKGAKNKLVDPHCSPEFKLRNQLLPIHSNFYYHGKKYEALALATESPRGSDEGYVKGPRAYMATDDLVLTPWSPILALNLINRLEIPLNGLKEKLVTIGVKECLSILKASLISTSALTNGLRHFLTEVKEEIVENRLLTEVKEEPNKKAKLRRRT